MSNPNIYKALRVSSTATPKEIKTAFLKLAILYDESKDPLNKEIMEIIDDAYYVLRDPERRAKYDLETAAFGIQSSQKEELSKAGKIINSWQLSYTLEEEEYIEKKHSINRIIKIAIALGGAIFFWSVIVSRSDIALSIVFILVLVYRIIWPIFRVKNPPPPPEVWGVK